MRDSTIVTEDEYNEAVDANRGWCPACQEFTRPETELDAEDLDCPLCDGQNVVGAEAALSLYLIEL